MVLLEGIALGWLLIVIGAVLLLVEVHTPGFFATVPATVLIFLGILLLLGVDIFNSGWGDYHRCNYRSWSSRVYRLDVWKDDARRKPDDYQQGLSDWYGGSGKDNCGSKYTFGKSIHIQH